MANRIVISAPVREKIPVQLVGVEYLVYPPKGMTGVALAEAAQGAGEDPIKLIKILNDWIETAFGSKQAAKVRARLSDDSDDLDLAQIMELMGALVKGSTPDPTT